MKTPFKIGEDVVFNKKQYRVVEFGYSKDEIDNFDGCWVVDESLPINKKKCIFKLFEQLREIEE